MSARNPSAGLRSSSADDPLILPVELSPRRADPRARCSPCRTRPDTVIDQAPNSVAFEIDAIDPVHHEGWSVLVRGELLHATSTSAEFRGTLDSHSWLADRTSWLLIDPWAITGPAMLRRPRVRVAVPTRAN